MMIHDLMNHQLYHEITPPVSMMATGDSICSLSEEHDDVQVNVMHPHGPAAVF